MISNDADDVIVKWDNHNNMKKPTSLLEGMQTILDYAKGSELNDTYFEDVKIPMDYLCHRLCLNPTQVTLLAIIMELNFQRRVCISDISRYLNTRNLHILSKRTDLTVLYTRRFIMELQDRCDTYYTIPTEVYDTFRRDEVYVHSIPMLHNDEELSEHLDNMLRKIDQIYNENNIDIFDRDVREMLFANKHIHLARILLGILNKTTEDEFRVVLLMSLLWIRDEDIDIEGQRFSIVIKQPLKVRQMLSSLQKGKSVLTKKNIVKVSCSDELLSNNVFALAATFRKSLTPDRFTNYTNGNEPWSNRLTRHTNIKQKPMFYNPDTIREIDRLQNILQPEQMDNVLARLKERDMRGGFTCLLYGGPGTGKTETVLQLARNSKRDIYQVDVSQLRSKWYGESERLVKGIFDEYRQMVAKSNIAPIIFFNEADAIFNSRMKNAQRSVDKTENALQNILLQEMETFNGILIATTNLQENLDTAFERRFLYKLHIEKPTNEVKACIWQSMIPDLSNDDAQTLAIQFDFSGGQIENVARKRIIDEILSGKKIDIKDLITLCQNEWLDNKKHNPIGFMRNAG